MNRRGPRTIQLLAGVVLSGLFLWLALRGEDWGAIGTEIARADLRWIALTLPLGAYVLYARSQRWRILLERSHGCAVAMEPIYSASAIGFMANMVLPFRVGEIARPYLVARSTGLSMATTFATVIVERVLDLMALAVFGIGIVLIADVPPAVTYAAEAVAAITVIAFGGAYFVTVHRGRVLPVLDRLWAKIPVVGPVVLRLEHEFVDGMSSITDPATMLRAVIWSLYIWCVIAVGFAFGFRALGLDVPFLGGGITVTTVVALAVSVPSAPAFVGQFEWGCKLALEQVYGVVGSAAVSYSLLLHAAQFVTQNLIGMVFLVREGLSLRDLSRLDEKVQEPV
ncbi:MAG: flippase-like domain-containing protein [Deltaproteobacteria bacterium]|nr:flippase-like domain-containing protein [Deltaproteobacteria bacterium]